MPLNSAILAQTANPPAPANPLAQYGQFLSLQNALGQQQLQKRQIQQEDVQLHGQQVLDSVMKSAFKPNEDGTVSVDQNAVAQGLASGGAGHLVPSVTKGLTDMQESAAKAKKAQIDAKTAANDYVAQGLATIHDSDFDPTTAIGVISHAAATGLLPKDQAAQLIGQISTNPTKENTKALISPFFNTPGYQELLTKRQTANASTSRAESAAQSAATSAAKETREAAVQNRAQLASQLGAATSQAEYQKILGAAPFQLAQEFAGKTPEQARRMAMTPEQQTQADQAAATLANTKDYQRKELAQGAQRIATGNAELDLRNKEYQQKYGDVLNNMTPDNRAIAEKIASGDFNPSQLTRFPNKEQLIAGAIAINPAWTQATYDTKQSFTNPEKTQAKNLGTISRIVGHIERFEENSKALGLAPAYASGMTVTGKQSAAREDAHAIAGELEKLVSGGVGSESQIKAWQSALSSPFEASRQKAVDEISQLIGSQYEGMNQTFKAGTGQDLPIQKYVSPAGQKWLQSKGINVGSQSQSAAIPDSIKQILLKAGPGIHTGNDGVTYVVGKDGSVSKQ